MSERLNEYYIILAPRRGKWAVFVANRPILEGLQLYARISARLPAFLPSHMRPGPPPALRRKARRACLRRTPSALLPVRGSAARVRSASARPDHIAGHEARNNTGENSAAGNMGG